ncbi:MAG TPA: hypothetical protein VGL23_09565 [Chloroflexota bacterium]|jgi:uncharacterized membrane protein YphA (DoxX/SURF4 family)
MAVSLISLAGAVRAVVGALVLVVGAIVVASVLGSGLAFLGLMLWLLTIGLVGVGVLLIARVGRPIAGAGAIVTAVSLWLAFQYEMPAIVWTVVFLVGIGLIVRGTAQDSMHVGAWALVIPRVMFGWAWIDNAQDHFRSGWLPGGAGGYAQIVNGAAGRPATYFLDPLYQGFLRGTVAPNLDTFAALTICGELTFGALLAVGLLTPVAAAGLLWQSLHYVEMKSFVSHGSYTDKVFFAVDLFCLITLVGLSYGLDASLRHVAPAFLRSLMGVPAADEVAAVPEPRPGLA